VQDDIATLRAEPSALLAARQQLEEAQLDREKFLKLMDTLQVKAGSVRVLQWGGGGGRGIVS
jgi:hypothetical protein